MDNKKQDVEVEFDEKGVAKWQDNEGNVIAGLGKEHFINGNSKKADHNHAKKQFFLYQVQVKKYRASLFQEKANALLEEAEAYETKAANVGKEPTAEEKAQAKRERLLKQLKASEEEMKALGLSV